MNIEAYNLDSLRKLVRNLQDENKRLKELLDKADVAYESENVFEDKIETIEEYDPDQGGRIQSKYITPFALLSRKWKSSGHLATTPNRLFLNL